MFVSLTCCPQCYNQTLLLPINVGLNRWLSLLWRYPNMWITLKDQLFFPHEIHIINKNISKLLWIENVESLFYNKVSNVDDSFAVRKNSRIGKNHEYQVSVRRCNAQCGEFYIDSTCSARSVGHRLGTHPLGCDFLFISLPFPLSLRRSPHWLGGHINKSKKT